MMDALMLILFGMILVICIMIGIYFTLYNKIQDYAIRINEVEMVIDNNLREKYDQINKFVSAIKNNDKIKIEKNILEEIVKLKNKKISNFNLDRKLIEMNNYLDSLKEKNKTIKNNEEITEISRKINDIDELLLVNKEYYNRNIAEYNKLIKMFPTSIVANICKYEEKLFFDKKDMSDSDYNDFKL